MRMKFLSLALALFLSQAAAMLWLYNVSQETGFRLPF